MAPEWRARRADQGISAEARLTRDTDIARTGHPALTAGWDWRCRDFALTTHLHDLLFSICHYGMSGQGLDMAVPGARSPRCDRKGAGLGVIVRGRAGWAPYGSVWGACNAAGAAPWRCWLEKLTGAATGRSGRAPENEQVWSLTSSWRQSRGWTGPAFALVGTCQSCAAKTVVAFAIADMSGELDGSVSSWSGIAP